MTTLDKLPLQIKRSKQAKRLALRLDTKERVINLVIPSRCPLHKAEEFVDEHRDWIHKTIRELPPTIPFEHGRIIPILGRERRIFIRENDSGRGTEITLDDKRLIVTTNLDNPHGRIVRFLKDLAHQELSRLAHRKAERIGKSIKSITMRDTKSRWGSCASDRTLTFSWRLIFAPYAAFDYVVAHEVAHLKHLDHSSKFWALCRELSRDIVEGEYWIRNHGHELMRYGQQEE